MLAFVHDVVEMVELLGRQPEPLGILVAAVSLPVAGKTSNDALVDCVFGVCRIDWHGRHCA
ncbi:hypothetical protein ABEW79_33420, partial [Delftia tsuruhatensis]